MTGTTGFVGKVLLEKFLRTMPHFRKIFVMVRPKKNMTVQKRLETEILSSKIFKALFKQNPSLYQLCLEKVVPIAGDLIVDQLGISVEDRAMVVAETEIVINCAASVNFDDPLLDALQINYFGSLRMLDLASECVNIKCFCNISTAYTNSNYMGNNFIEEKIYDLESGVDPEEVVQKIINMGPLVVKEKE